MTPDQQHKKYYKENPQGNHYAPSEITKEFMKEQRSINSNVLGLVTNIDKVVAIMAKDVEGIHEQTKRTNGRVNDIDEIQDTYKSMWKRQKRNAEDTSNRLRDWAWKIGVGVLLLLVGVEKISSLIN